jgi:hypothetical protein
LSGAGTFIVPGVTFNIDTGRHLHDREEHRPRLMHGDDCYCPRPSTPDKGEHNRFARKKRELLTFSDPKKRLGS